jgi:hypothetical protein
VTAEGSALPAAGYASAEYAAAFGHDVLRAAACGGHLTLRPIAGTDLRDASGCYPVFSCARPRSLGEDLAGLPSDLVALALVPDPLQDFDRQTLQAWFPIVRPLGEHYVVELDEPRRGPSSHHLRMLRRAAKHRIECRLEPSPPDFLERWVALYGNLVERAGIRGRRRFSTPVFQAMLAVPGSIVFTGWEDGRLLGADWYYQDQDRVYAHLSAYADRGYELSVSYPLLEAAISYFAQRASIIDLGGVPTLAAPADGLLRFKSGWATGVRPAHLCGIAPNLAAYLQQSGGRPPSAQMFFPYYRRSDYG